MENLIKDVTANVLHVEPNNVEVAYRLMGGMSNFMYVVKVNGLQYTFRIPGKNAEVFVDRVEELENIKKVDVLHINNKTLYLDTKTGYKLAEYVEGVPLSDKENPEDYLNEVASVLKRLHESNVSATKDYNPEGRLASYEQLVLDLNFKHDPKYDELKSEFCTYLPELNKIEKVFCHNDSQISNIVVEGEQVYLLDWEFGGNNDPLYDVACVGNKEFELAVKFLPVYLGRDPKPSEFKRLYVWRAFQCLQWHNVAMYKELIGLSADLGVDFKFVSGLYLQKAEQFLKDARQY
ncbi:MAG TPA: phosphotransferase [Firmicutes bacterium]|nr:phosphotransferase [Bacillota bacterium]